MNSKGVVSAVISLLSTSLPDIAVAPEFSNIKQALYQPEALKALSL